MNGVLSGGVTREGVGNLCINIAVTRRYFFSNSPSLFITATELYTGAWVWMT